MKTLLQQKLHSYLTENNPDILITLTTERRLTAYLEDKVSSVDGLLVNLSSDDLPDASIIEQCMDALTSDLRPSKYHLVAGILAAEFELNYTEMRETGTLTYEIMNILNTCSEVFDLIPLTAENTDDRSLRYALIGCIQDYLWSILEK